jgi:hypothetical protein
MFFHIAHAVSMTTGYVMVQAAMCSYEKRNAVTNLTPPVQTEGGTTALSKLPAPPLCTRRAFNLLDDMRDHLVVAQFMLACWPDKPSFAPAPPPVKPIGHQGLTAIDHSR